MRRSAKTEKKRNIQGFTILEIIVAMFIFGCISAALLKALASADKIGGRALLLRNATNIAQNEIESIRNKTAFFHTVEDCTYVTSIGNREFEVKRQLLVNDEDIFGEKDNSLLQIEISITEASLPNIQLLKFRFLQGYSW